MIAGATNGLYKGTGVPKKHAPFADSVKAEAVARVQGGESTWQVAQSLKAHNAQVRDWCRGAGVKPPPTLYDEAFIHAAVARIKAGESLGSVSLTLGVGRKTLHHWLDGKPTMKDMRAAVDTLIPHPSAPKEGSMTTESKSKANIERRTFDDAFKHSAVARVKGGEAQQAVADSIGVQRSVLGRWVNGQGISRLPKGEKQLIKKAVAQALAGVTVSPTGVRTYSEEFKRAAVARVHAGERASIVMKELDLGNSNLYVWLKAAGKKRKYEKRAVLPGAAKELPMATALAVRDAITYLKHVKTDMYMLLQTGQIKEFEEYHLNVLAALKRLQSVT